MSGTIYLGEEDTRFNASGKANAYFALQGEEGSCKLAVLSGGQYNYLKSKATYDDENDEYVLEGVITGPLLERESLEDNWTLDGETVYGTQYLRIRDRSLSARVCREETSVIYGETVE